MARIDKPTVVADAVGLLSLARDLHPSGRYKAAEAIFQQVASHVENMLGPHDVFLANMPRCARRLPRQSPTWGRSGEHPRTVESDSGAN
jgi:hypothetical protein